LPIKKQPERRQFGRRQVFKPAEIVLDDGRRFACAVIDFSDAGARIKLATIEFTENEFDLEISADDFVVRCQIMHADEPSIGVRFIKPPRRISWKR
jgi:hypothetical protein